VTLLLADQSIYHNITAFFSDADDQLFSRISHNVTHVLKPLLPIQRKLYSPQYTVAIIIIIIIIYYLLEIAGNRRTCMTLQTVNK